MSTKPSECLKKLINFLHKKGLYENHCSDKQFFGNEIYLFETDNMLIRVMSDRGIWSIEVSSKIGRYNEFHEFSYIISYFEGSPPHARVSIDEEADYFVANYNNISTLFNRKNHKSTIEMLQSKRLEYLKTQSWYNAWVQKDTAANDSNTSNPGK